MHAKWTGFKKYTYNNFSYDMLNGLDLIYIYIYIYKINFLITILLLDLNFK